MHLLIKFVLLLLLKTEEKIHLKNFKWYYEYQWYANKYFAGLYVKFEDFMKVSESLDFFAIAQNFVNFK